MTGAGWVAIGLLLGGSALFVLLDYTFRYGRHS